MKLRSKLWLLCTVMILHQPMTTAAQLNAQLKHHGLDWESIEMQQSGLSPSRWDSATQISAGNKIILGAPNGYKNAILRLTHLGNNHSVNVPISVIGMDYMLREITALKIEPNKGT